MTIENIQIEESIKHVRKLLAEEKEISPALKAAIEIIILALTLICNKLGLNSSNSSIPPSQDRFRKKEKKSKGKKAGGQNGHKGKTLEKIDDPDETIEHKIKSCKKCNKNLSYQKNEDYEIRQVFDIVIKRNVIEHKSQVKTCAKCGTLNIGKFPKEVTKSVQYGVGVKSLSTYMSQFQLIPYERIKDFFVDQLDLPISVGTIFNFNMSAYNKLSNFENQIKVRLHNSPVNHSDETGININGKNAWLHSLSNSKYTYFHPHYKRGSEAMDEIGVLPKYGGILCHDHWKPYFKYNCSHSLCNAHHIRELEYAHEKENQKWAKLMKNLLVEINKSVIKSDGKLEESEIKKYQKIYRTILTNGKKECPIPEKVKGKRGRIKKTKSRNLLERLQLYEKETLIFMWEEEVPFTNNQAESDIRMTKVQQKISGCFRSMDGAKIFCRVRSYLSTARKNSVSSYLAIRALFLGNEITFTE